MARVLFISNKRIALILAALLAVGYLLIAEEPERPIVHHMAVAAQGRSMPLFYVIPSRKEVALTLDISWGTKILPPVLKILDQHDVRATFFLSGPWAEHHPDLVEAIVAGGHEIASHGEEHINLSQYDRNTIVHNITSAHNALKNLSGREPRFFRPPNGDYDDLVVETALELNYETVIWSVDSLDWKNPGPDYMIRRVRDLVFPGAVILFHASDSSRQVDQALPTVIKDLRAAGYDVVTLGEMYDRGRPGRRDPRGDPDYPPVTDDDILPEEPAAEPTDPPAASE